MDCNDDDRSLRRIALRILNEDERQAQDEVDEVIQGIDGYLGTQSRLYAWPIPITIVFPVFFLIMSRLASLYSKTWENILFGIALLACFLPFGILWYWRRDQYGSGRLWKPREAIYADASDETRETLERLFAYLRLDSSPKIYCLDRKGVKQSLDRGYRLMRRASRQRYRRWRSPSEERDRPLSWARRSLLARTLQEKFHD